MEGNTGVEPITSQAEATEARREVAVSCFPLTEKFPARERGVRGSNGSELPHRENHHWRKCNKPSFDQTCKYKYVECVMKCGRVRPSVHCGGGQPSPFRDPAFNFNEKRSRSVQNPRGGEADRNPKKHQKQRKKHGGSTDGERKGRRQRQHRECSRTKALVG